MAQSNSITDWKQSTSSSCASCDGFWSRINEIQMHASTNIQSTVNVVPCTETARLMTPPWITKTVAECGGYDECTHLSQQQHSAIMLSNWRGEGQIVSDLLTVPFSLLGQNLPAVRFHLVWQYDGRVFVLYAMWVLYHRVFNTVLIHGCYQCFCRFQEQWRRLQARLLRYVDLYFIYFGPKSSLGTSPLEVGNFVYGISVSTIGYGSVTFCTCMNDWRAIRKWTGRHSRHLNLWVDCELIYMVICLA